MKRALLLCMLLAAAPLPAFTQGTASAPPGGRLLIFGSSIMAPMVEGLAKRFSVLHPGVVIAVEAGGAGRGSARVVAGNYVDVVRLIRANRNAIAYLSAAPIDDLVKKGQPLKMLALFRERAPVRQGLKA